MAGTISDGIAIHFPAFCKQDFELLASKLQCLQHHSCNSFLSTWAASNYMLHGTRQPCRAVAAQKAHP
jgi:hypothetical protein